MLAFRQGGWIDLGATEGAMRRDLPTAAHFGPKNFHAIPCSRTGVLLTSPYTEC